MEDEGEVPVWNDVENENPGPFSEEGKPHGVGTLTYPPPPVGDDDDGEEKQAETFAGSLTHGIRDGKGKYTWPDGSSYEGEYMNDKRHGRGTMKFANGGSYSGMFAAGQLSGGGVMKYANGDIYKGSFHNGQKEGQGCYHFAKFQCQFIGTFEGGAFKQGRWIHSDGSFIHGAFDPAPGQPENCTPVGPAKSFFARPGLTQEGEFDTGTWIGGEIVAA